MDKMLKEKINERLAADFDYVTKMGHEVLGVFLQGSQNYGLEYEGSDIDTKAIIIPKLDDLVFNRKPVSTTIILPNNEHIDVKDIRLMHDCFKKQNINFIEILFTEFKIINPKYAELYQPMFDNAEDIAHLNEVAAVNCMVGMMNEKYKALKHPYPATKDKIEKYGYDPKQLHHILRISRFLEDYVTGSKYIDCLKPSPGRREFLIKIKQCPPYYNLEDAERVAKRELDLVTSVRPRLELEGYNIITGELLNHCQASVIKAAIKSEMGD